MRREIPLMLPCYSRISVIGRLDWYVFSLLAEPPCYVTHVSFQLPYIMAFALLMVLATLVLPRYSCKNNRVDPAAILIDFD